MSLLNEKDLAERWQMTTRTLQSWRATGKGPRFIKIGERSIMYRIEDVLSYEDVCIVGKDWKGTVKRAASAFDVLAGQAKSETQKQTLSGLRDELRALLG